MSIKPDKVPGHYPGPIDIQLTGDQIVDTVALSKNGPPPANSKYIAYDELTPPSPFLAVTQDGKGNVVYDGGFPKFYNNKSQPINTPFSELKPQYKFLWNAINFIANKEKVLAGNKKVLLVGDRKDGSYHVKSTAGSGFKKSFENVILTMGYELTIKNSDDYGGLIDPTLSELEQYCCVIFMSSWSTTVPKITESAVNNFVSYRQNGNGLFFITDHGAVINDLDTAVNGSYGGFFRTANAVVVNFGAWFSGDYNRTSVNVGYLRENYGDHPLYSGLSDSESIHAGGSESEVVLADNDTYTADLIPNVTVSKDGDNTVNLLSVTIDGEVVTDRLLYTIGDIPLVSIKTISGLVPFNGTIVTNKRFADFEFISNYPSLGTLVGELSIDGIYLGTITITDDQVEYQWITSPQTPIISGSDLKLKITQPYTYVLNWTIDRQSLDFTDGRSVSNLFDTDFVENSGLGVIRNINEHLHDSLRPIYRPDTASLMDVLEEYDSGDLVYDPIEVYIVGGFQRIFSNRDFSPADKIIAVNRFTREVYLPTKDGWVLSEKSAGGLLGVGRMLVDKQNGFEYETTNQGISTVDYPEQTPLYDDQIKYGYCSVIQNVYSGWYTSSEVPDAKWIWDRIDAGIRAPVGESVHLRKWFYSPYTGSATLTIALDDEANGVWVNGELVKSGIINHATGETHTINVRKGMNLIHVECINHSGPAGLMAYIQTGDGEILTKTDASWLKYSIPKNTGSAIEVSNKDDVSIPYNSNTVLSSSDEFEFEVDIRTSAAVGGALLGIHHDIIPRDPEIHKGLILHTKVGFSHVEVGMNTGELDSRINVATDTSHPSFINIFDGQWHNIKVTYDGSCTPEGLNIYMDGVLQVTYQFSGGTAVSGMGLNENSKISVSGAPVRIGARGNGSGGRGFTFDVADYKNFKIIRNGVVIGYYPMHDSYNGRFYDYGVYSVHSNVTPKRTTTWVTKWNTSKNTSWTTAWTSNFTTSWTTNRSTSRDTSHTTSWNSNYTTNFNTSKSMSKTTNYTTSWGTSKTTTWGSSRTTSYTTTWTGSRTTSKATNKTTSWTTSWSVNRTTSKSTSKTTSWTTKWGASKTTSKSTSKSYSRTTSKSTSWTTKWTGDRSTSRTTTKTTSKTTSRITLNRPPDQCISLDTPLTLPTGEKMDARRVKVGDVLRGVSIPGMIDESDPNWRQWTTRNITPPSHTDVTVRNVQFGTFRALYVVNGKLSITKQHEILASRNGRWSWWDVRDLEIGDIVLNDSLEEISIETIDLIKGKFDVVSIDVEESDTYFAGGLLVHNLPPNVGGGVRPPTVKK